MPHTFTVTNTIPYTVTWTFTSEQIANILCNALEGGSNYWYWIESSIKPTTWDYEEDGRHYLHDYPLNPGGALIICDKEEAHEEGHATYRLDRDALQRGLDLLSDQYLHEIDTGQDDAETADALLQVSLFGTIIYS